MTLEDFVNELETIVETDEKLNQLGYQNNNFDKAMAKYRHKIKLHGTYHSDTMKFKLTYGEIIFTVEPSCEFNYTIGRFKDEATEETIKTSTALYLKLEEVINRLVEDINSPH